MSQLVVAVAAGIAVAAAAAVDTMTGDFGVVERDVGLLLLLLVLPLLPPMRKNESKLLKGQSEYSYHGSKLDTKRFKGMYSRCSKSELGIQNAVPIPNVLLLISSHFVRDLTKKNNG